MGASVRLGPYRLLQRLGSGGMGVVHLAVDRRGRAVAVKVLREHVAADPDARARLAREVATQRRIDDRRVAAVLDADTRGPRPYFVTRFVDGASLDEVVRDGGPLGPAALHRLASGLAGALHAIHAAGVTHRDVKPGNILVEDGEPVLIDFGIAHLVDDHRLTMTGLVMGTPGYLAPEIVEGAEVSDATDWWGWAASLLFAATGRPPFGTGPMDAVLTRVCQGRPDLEGVDPALAPLLAAALSPTAADRPTDTEVVDALERLSRGEPVAPALRVVPETSTLAPAATRAIDEVPAASGTSVITVPETRAQPQAPRTAVMPLRAAEPAPPPAPAPVPAPMMWEPAPQPVPVVWQPPPPVPQPHQPGGATVWAPQDARTGRPNRSGLLASVLALVVVGACVLPVVTLAAALVAGSLARTVDRTTTGLALRRHRYGARGSDVAVAFAASPWNLLISTLATAFWAVIPLVLGVGAALLAGAVVVAGIGRGGVATAVAAAAGSVVALLAAWWGPGGGALRRGSRSVARVVAPTAWVSVILSVLVLGAAAVLGLSDAVEQLGPSLWPVGGPVERVLP